MRDAERVAVILGIADGLVIVLGLLISLHHHQPAIFSASLGAGIAEWVGMSAALWLTAKRNVVNFTSAMACGTATAAACILPAIPYLITSGVLALGSSLGIIFIIGAVITWLRPEKGALAVAETYGVLGLAGLLCYLVTFIHF